MTSEQQLPPPAITIPPENKVIRDRETLVKGSCKKDATHVEVILRKTDDESFEEVKVLNVNDQNHWEVVFGGLTQGPHFLVARQTNDDSRSELFAPRNFLVFPY